MTRREFLISTTALAGSPGLPALAGPGADPSPAAATLLQDPAAPGHRYVIAVQGSAVTLDCLPDHLASLPRAAGLSSKPLVVVGESPVVWQAPVWAAPLSTSLDLSLKSVGHPLVAELSFVLDPSSGLLTRKTVLRHVGGDAGDLDVTATTGFSVFVHEPIERIIHLTGAWTEEAEIQRAHPAHGTITLESRSGKTGFDFQPYVALRTQRATYVCELLWSGNWLLRVVPYDGGALVEGGFNDWHFRHRLSAGDTLELPAVVFGRSEGALGAATRRLHDYRRARRPNPDRPIPVQFNSWYPYLGEPSAAALIPLVPLVKRLGCEAFVVDAGWYRTEESESDAEWDQRTGDWRTSRQRFPKGLREISTLCHEVGLRFGLWFEPEVIAAQSSIRRAHPQWLHHIAGKAPAPADRAVLNLGVPEAWQHVFDRLSFILRLVGVDWMKWDFNADLGEGGWSPGLPEALTGQSPLVAHYEGLYRLQDAIRAEFPDLVLEMCASGGGRMDGGILSHAHVNWMSDQSGALRKLAMHFGTQLAHPAVVCNDWLIDWPGDNGRTELASLVDPRGDLPFRLRVAMLGTFGVSAPVDRWSASDIATTRAHIDLYKDRLRPLIHHGDQYILTQAPPSDGNGDWAAIFYAAKDGFSGVLFAFRLAGESAARTFRLPGLHKGRRYRLIPFTGETSTLPCGDSGLETAVSLEERFRSQLCVIEAVAS